MYGILYYIPIRNKKFNLATPGRGEEEIASMSGLNDAQLISKAASILEAIGTKSNIEAIDACITRIRLTVKDDSKLNEARVKDLGAAGVMKIGAKTTR